nr:hypothetical protein [Tanacetum cinerariifolium]
MSLTKAAEEEAARQVHATHERIVTKVNPEPATRIPSKKPAVDTMQAFKEIKKSSRTQPHVRGLSAETGTKKEVVDESTVIPATSSEGIEESELFEEENVNEEINWVYCDKDEEKKDDDDDDDKSINLEKTDDKET